MIRVTKDISLLRYCWRTNSELFLQGFYVGSRPYRRIATLLNTVTGKETLVDHSVMETLPTKLQASHKDVAPPNSYCSIAPDGDWLFSKLTNGGTIVVIATNLNHRGIRSWKIPFKGLFGGSLLALPDKHRWLLIVEQDSQLLAVTGDVHNSGKVQKLECYLLTFG